MKQHVLALALAAALLLCACGAPSAQSGALYSVYYRTELSQSGGADAVCAVGTRAEGESAERIASALLRRMLAGTQDGGVSPLPEGTQVLDVAIDDGVAVVNLSAEYTRLSGMDLTLADACIALTLSQLPEVERVSVLAQGQPLPYRERQSMAAEDLLLSRMDDEARTLRARLYFLSAATGELTAETRTLQLAEGQTRAEAVLFALLSGPETEGLLPLLPEGVQVLSVRMDEGICYVSFSRDFLKNAPQTVQEQENVLYSVVKSLCGLGDIQAVQIAVEGGGAYYGRVEISAPLRG